jgi:hypothetical protein
MNTSEIKQKLVSASYQYHRDTNARLESVQIGELPFRLVRTQDYYQSSIDTYLVKTPDEYSDFNYEDLRVGKVRLLKTFTLPEIKNSKRRESFSIQMSEKILEELGSEFTSLEQFF